MKDQRIEVSISFGAKLQELSLILHLYLECVYTQVSSRILFERRLIVINFVCPLRIVNLREMSIYLLCGPLETLIEKK